MSTKGREGVRTTAGAFFVAPKGSRVAKARRRCLSWVTGDEKKIAATSRLCQLSRQQTRVSLAQVLNGPAPGVRSLLRAGGGTGFGSLRPEPGTPRIHPDSERGETRHDYSGTSRHFIAAESRSRNEFCALASRNLTEIDGPGRCVLKRRVMMTIFNSG